MVEPLVIDAFATAIAANACGVHGPFGPVAAAGVAASLATAAAGHAPVAVSPRDALVAELGLVAALEAADASVLTPDDPDWRTRLPGAGAGVTGALLGVAETGTLALATGLGAPRATSLLPPVHVCVVAVADLVGTFAEAVDRLARDPLPSALMWIGGPSRTGDLEMVITMGVHGPERVEVVLVAG